MDRTTESGLGGFRPGPDLVFSTMPFGIIGGVAAGDVDNDGDIDLFVVTEGTRENTLYVNQGDGTFSATLLAGLADTPLYESGPLFVDYDGDGLLDIIMGGVRTDAERDQLNSVRVYHNLGGLSFVDVSATAGVTPPLEQDTYSISAADINGDQTLDLFLSHWGLAPSVPYTTGGGFIWSNDGAGSFTDITTQAGLDDLQFTHTFTGNFSDIDGDADLDLLVASDYGSSRAFVNDGGVFSESAGSSVLTDEAGMGAAVGDYDNDGDMDWFVSSIFALSGGVDDRVYRQPALPERWLGHVHRREPIGRGARGFLGLGELLRGFRQRRLARLVPRQWLAAPGDRAVLDRSISPVHVERGWDVHRSVLGQRACGQRAGPWCGLFRR